MPMRRILVIFTIALAVAGAGYSAYWFHVAGEMRKNLERWAEDRRAHGWTVAWSELHTGGYPLHLRLDMDSPHLVSPAGFSWAAERLSGNVDPFDWTRLRMEATGPHDLSWPGGGGTLTAALARMDINFNRHGVLQDATLIASDVVEGGTAPTPATIAGLAVTWDPLAVAATPDHLTATTRFSATAHGIALPVLADLPLERTIGLVEITGRVMGLPTDGPTAQSLARWSADGGTVELDHVALDWAPMALEAEGTLALDPAGQPLAALSARVRGFSPLMDRLTAAGLVDAGAANAAKLVLSLMARPDPKGRQAVPVPVSIQDSVVFLGPATVARLPRVSWGEFSPE